MYHLDNTSGVPEMPEPKEQQSVTPLWFGESVEQGGISWPGADWFNIIQAEMLNAVAAAELAPDKGAYNQLAQAIEKLGGRLLQEKLSSRDGLKMMGQCANYAELRTQAPDYSGQQIFVRRDSQSESMTFISMSWMKLLDFPDDGGTRIAASDGQSVWINADLIRNPGVIRAEWFSTSNDYVEDSTQKLQAALDAASFWARVPAEDTRGLFAQRYKVVFPQKWFASRTLKVDAVCCYIDLNRGLGVFLQSGDYTQHPLRTDKRMAFYYESKKPSDDLFIPAYNDWDVIVNGTLAMGYIDGGRPNQGSLWNKTEWPNVCAIGHHGLTSTLYGALGKIRNVCIGGFGETYINGDFAWGLQWWGAKFIGNGGTGELINGKDNGESFEFWGCVALNNGKFITPAGWGGKVNWMGGNLDYFKIEKPCVWSDNCNMQINIDGPFMEFNPFHTKNFFDLSKGSNVAHLGLKNIKLTYAVPSREDGGGVVNDDFIKYNPDYPEQICVDTVTIVDASASGEFTKNYQFVADAGKPVRVSNITPVTLKDYFINSCFLNRQRTAKWQYYFSGSQDFDIAISDNEVTITGKVGSVVSDKSVFIYIPMQAIVVNYQYMMCLLNCTRSDVPVSFAVWSGYTHSAAPGLVNDGSFVLDAPVGAEQLVNLNVGKNTNIIAYAGGAAYGGFDLASYSRPADGKPAEGLIVRLWLRNFVEGSKVTLTKQSGMITL